jgi:hypothetical protein
VCLQHLEQGRRFLAGQLMIDRTAEQFREARLVGAVEERPLGDREPALDPRRGNRIGRQPGPGAVIFVGQIDEDGD